MTVALLIAYGLAAVAIAAWIVLECCGYEVDFARWRVTVHNGRSRPRCAAPPQRRLLGPDDTTVDLGRWAQ